MKRKNRRIWVRQLLEIDGRKVSLQEQVVLFRPSYNFIPILAVKTEVPDPSLPGTSVASSQGTSHPQTAISSCQARNQKLQEEYPELRCKNCIGEQSIGILQYLHLPFRLFPGQGLWEMCQLFGS